MKTGPVQSSEVERSCPECGNSVNPRAVVCVHCGVSLQSSPEGGAAHPATGLPSNTAAALCYPFTLITGIIFLLMTKDDELVRFHAKQAIAVGVAFIVLLIAVTIVNAILSLIFGFIPAIAIIGAVLTTLLSLAVWVGGLALVIFLMVSAYQGKRFQLPVLGNLAANWQV
jgi:uncharacterized membrane protein